jgi:hypothetical protein
MALNLHVWNLLNANNTLINSQAELRVIELVPETPLIDIVE